PPGTTAPETPDTCCPPHRNRSTCRHRRWRPEGSPVPYDRPAESLKTRSDQSAGSGAVGHSRIARRSGRIPSPGSRHADPRYPQSVVPSRRGPLTVPRLPLLRSDERAGSGDVRHGRPAGRIVQPPIFGPVPASHAEPGFTLVISCETRLNYLGNDHRRWFIPSAWVGL